MKKIIAIIISLSFLCGCTMTVKNDNPSTTNNVPSNTASTTNHSTTNVAQSTPTPTELGLDLAKFSPEPITWGPGNIKEHKRPTDPANLEKRFKTLNAQWLLNESKNICLTFDEGYENGFTPQILDTLKEKNVKAIFFCTYDYIKDNPDIVKRMIAEGHIVGNHSYRHYNMTEVDTETARDEVTLLHDYMAEQFGYEMTLFRFPEGEFSEQNLAIVNSLGYKSVFWSFAYADWDTSNPPDPDTAYKKITSSTHDGAILLLHAVSSTNAGILPNVIDDIRSQGYTFTIQL